MPNIQQAFDFLTSLSSLLQRTLKPVLESENNQLPCLVVGFVDASGSLVLFREDKHEQLLILTPLQGPYYDGTEIAMNSLLPAESTKSSG